MQRLLLSRDGLAGLMFVGFGLFGLWFGRDYNWGTAVRVGPGALPFVLSAGMILLGTLIALRGVIAGSDRVAMPRARPIVAVTAGLVAFTLLLETAGLPFATFCCAGIGALGNAEVRVREALALAVFLSAFITAIFVFGLGMPLKLWP